LQHDELVSEQRDLGKQRTTRAKEIRHRGGEQEHRLEHGRAKRSDKVTGSLADPRSSQDGSARRGGDAHFGVNLIKAEESFQ
jgi:hypothetical protein